MTRTTWGIGRLRGLAAASVLVSGCISDGGAGTGTPDATAADARPADAGRGATEVGRPDADPHSDVGSRADMHPVAADALADAGGRPDVHQSDARPADAQLADVRLSDARLSDARPADARPADAREGSDVAPGDASMTPDGLPADAASVPDSASAPDAASAIDGDADGVPDDLDTCPRAPNPAQRDTDGDGLGDACDVGDSDGDGLADRDDPCPGLPAISVDTDGDGFGDACDVCPGFVNSEQADADRDGIGDACEVPNDDDGDGTADAVDNCPRRPNGDQLDTDADSVGDACDDCRETPDPEQADSDGDAWGDACDVCPDVPLAGADHLDVDGDGVPTCAGDCEDADPRAAPGLVERCDGLDNDCDGEVDQNYPVTGSPCSTGVGACRRDGVHACLPAGGGSICTARPGAPEPERCDGLDNDCDGLADEEQPDCCEPGETQACGAELGRCRRGISVCGPERRWGACDGQGPVDEVCNGEDDDCDGPADEGLGAVSCGLGVCRHELPACDPAAPPACDPLAGASAEVCNGLDDDCDGEVDEDLGTRVCGAGACVHEVAACAGGAVAACQPTEPLLAEICDAIDNDCDGVVDDVRGVPAISHPVYAGAQGLVPPIAGASGDRVMLVWNDPSDNTQLYAFVDPAGRVVRAPELLGLPEFANMVLAPIRAPGGGFALPYAATTVVDNLTTWHQKLVLVSAAGVWSAPIELNNSGAGLVDYGAASDGSTLTVVWGQRAQGYRTYLQPLDAQGHLQGVPLSWGPVDPAASMTNQLLVTNGRELMVAWRESVGATLRVGFRFFDDRRQPTTAPALLLGPLTLYVTAFITGPGGPFGVLYREEVEGVMQPRFVLVSPAGLASAPVSPFGPYTAASPAGGVWTGTDFVLAASSGINGVGPIGTLYRHVDASGIPTGPIYLGSGLGWARPDSFVSTGGDTLVARRSRILEGDEIGVLTGDRSCP